MSVHVCLWCKLIEIANFLISLMSQEVFKDQTQDTSSQCYKRITGLYLQVCKNRPIFVAISVVQFNIIMAFCKRTWCLRVKTSSSKLILTTHGALIDFKNSPVFTDL